MTRKRSSDKTIGQQLTELRRRARAWGKTRKQVRQAEKRQAIREQQG